MSLQAVMGMTNELNNALSGCFKKWGAFSKVSPEARKSLTNTLVRLLLNGEAGFADIKLEVAGKLDLKLDDPIVYSVMGMLVESGCLRQRKKRKLNDSPKAQVRQILQKTRLSESPRAHTAFQVYPVGSKVVVHGLQVAKEHNGKGAEVLAYLPLKDLFQIRIHGQDKTSSIRFKNLKLPSLFEKPRQDGGFLSDSAPPDVPTSEACAELAAAAALRPLKRIFEWSSPEPGGTDTSGMEEEPCDLRAWVQTRARYERDTRWHDYGDPNTADREHYKGSDRCLEEAHWRWIAQYRNRCLGYFDTEEEARSKYPDYIEVKRVHKKDAIAAVGETLTEVSNEPSEASSPTKDAELLNIIDMVKGGLRPPQDYLPSISGDNKAPPRLETPIIGSIMTSARLATG